MFVVDKVTLGKKIKKVKFALEEAVNAQRGSRSITLLYL
jgi:hypothetical protein